VPTQLAVSLAPMFQPTYAPAPNISRSIASIVLTPPFHTKHQTLDEFDFLRVHHFYRNLLISQNNNLHPMNNDKYYFLVIQKEQVVLNVGAASSRDS
jgi:hypothetical protein